MWVVGALMVRPGDHAGPRSAFSSGQRREGWIGEAGSPGVEKAGRVGVTLLDVGKRQPSIAGWWAVGVTCLRWTGVTLGESKRLRGARANAGPAADGVNEMLRRTLNLGDAERRWRLFLDGMGEAVARYRAVWDSDRDDW